MMDKFEKAYMKSIKLSKPGGGLNEGIASTLVKAGLKVASKAGKKAIKRGAESLAKKSGSSLIGKAAEKTMEVAASKTLSKVTPKIATKMVKQVAAKMNKFKIFKMLSKKRYLKALVVNKVLEGNTEDFKTSVELLIDYVKGNYISTPWTVIALLAASVAYIALPEEIGKKIEDSEIINKLLSETFTSCKSELDKYREWKLKNPQKAADLNNDERVISEFGDDLECLERSLLKECSNIYDYANITQSVARYIIFESAESDEEKIEELQKIDKDTANKIVAALKSHGAIPLYLSEKGSQFLSQGQKVAKLSIDSFRGKKKPDKESVKNILDQEGWFMKMMKNVFLKETLLSLIPFSQKPTIDDLEQFFLCMKDYVADNYDLSKPEFDALLEIGCDLGFSALSVALGGAAAFITFGLSTIFAVIGCAATLGYICDNMTIIGRIYKKRKAENSMKLNESYA